MFSYNSLILKDIATKIMKDMCPVESQKIVNRICCTAEKKGKYLKLNIRTFSLVCFGSQVKNVVGV